MVVLSRSKFLQDGNPDAGCSRQANTVLDLQYLVSGRSRRFCKPIISPNSQLDEIQQVTVYKLATFPYYSVVSDHCRSFLVNIDSIRP